jgi:hypothetical protein
MDSCLSPFGYFGKKYQKLLERVGATAKAAMGEIGSFSRASFSVPTSQSESGTGWVGDSCPQKGFASQVKYDWG